MNEYKELTMGELAGKKVISASINDDKDVIVLQTETGPLYLSWVGNCCSHCYLAHISGAENLTGSTILNIENAEWTQPFEEEGYEVTQTMGSKIMTSNGYVDFETRLDHNGYYSGKIRISEGYALDQYSQRKEEGSLVTLIDF